MTPQAEIIHEDLIVAKALLSGLNDLSSRAGHDLLGPLNQAASLLALFLKRQPIAPDPETGHLVEFLQSASVRIEGMLAGLRKYMELACKPPGFATVDMNASLASALSLLERAIAESGAVIVSDSLPPAWADASQMVILFEILIGNSIKFRRPDAPPRINVFPKQDGGALGIVIADNGIGIEREYCQTVLLPFKRLNGVQYPGAGLGLAMAKLIAETHGGRLLINPEPGNPSCGTDVLFTLTAATV
jgi:light-regulated signal transduction histidine kinase (bacteriophytochrome)